MDGSLITSQIYQAMCHGTNACDTGDLENYELLAVRN